MSSPVIHLTPGRCSSCGRFVAKDAAPDVWSVDVHPDYQQVPGEPNIWARTHCSECTYVPAASRLGWARPVSLAAAEERAALIGGAS